jgi:hypothetical protein
VADQAGAPAGRRIRSFGRALVNPDSAVNAAAWFAIATLVTTWPLARGLATDIPHDFGDPLLNCWILGWSADHLLRFLSGDLTAFAGFWQANIFHPAPMAFAYSEHLFAQAVQILPVYAVTGNLILCYNLLFLSTFFLSALGAYLLVRELTGDGRAGLLAGCAFGFAVFRIAHFPQLQVLSAQWMPFALYGLRRHFESGRWRPLAGGVLALIAQNLSCGYYLVFFTPFVGAYVLYEMWDRGRLRDVRLWGRMLLAAAVTVLATVPFLWPYLELRRLGFPPRSLDEVRFYSADVLAYLTTSPEVRLWGARMQKLARPEGELFPGLIPVVFACAAVGLHLWALWKGTRRAPPPSRWARPVVFVLVAVLALSLLAAVTILTGHRFVLEWGPITLRVMGLARTLRIAAVAFAGLIVLSPRVRALLQGQPRSLVGFCAAAVLVAFALSLGPTVTVGNVRLSDGWYLYLYKYVPGFDGLRVPARMGMLVALFLALLAGTGAAALVRASRRWRPAVLAACVLFLVESTPAPIRVNIPYDSRGLARTPARIETGRAVPAVYKYLRTLPADAVIIEFPFGATAYDLRYTYYSTVHWRRLVNGYSGGAPPWYQTLADELAWPLGDKSRAFAALRAHGVTHAVVHEDAYLDATGSQVAQWLRESGAVEIARSGRSRVLALGPS